MVEFYIPEPILIKIVSCIGQDGVDALRNWILAGPEGKVAVMADETLFSVRLDKCPQFPRWSRPTSSYHQFLSKCLQSGNPYAIYAQSIYLAFRGTDLGGAIAMLSSVKDHYPLAKLLFIMLRSCANIQYLKDYWKFKKQFCLREAIDMADSLMFHINSVGPRRWATYSDTWHFHDFPDCWQTHERLKEYNSEKCMNCIYYYLSKDIMLLS